MNDCRFGVSPVNYPDPDPENLFQIKSLCVQAGAQTYNPGIKVRLKETTTKSSALFYRSTAQ